MFRKYNKKIWEAIVIVIVGIGLIGPGVLLIFAPQPQTLPSYGGERLINPPPPTPTPTPPLAGPFTPLPESPTVGDIKDALMEVVTQVTKIQQIITESTLSGEGITQSLNQGTSGEQVTNLQNFLKSQGPDVYPEGLVTGYFGPLTREAVEKFQEKYDIAGPGDPGYGFVGPKTRTKINSLLGL